MLAFSLEVEGLSLPVRKRGSGRERGSAGFLSAERASIAFGLSVALPPTADAAGRAVALHPL